jgi:hypothetical protein
MRKARNADILVQAVYRCPECPRFFQSTPFIDGEKSLKIHTAKMHKKEILDDGTKKRLKSRF